MKVLVGLWEGKRCLSGLKKWGKLLIRKHLSNYFLISSPVSLIFHIAFYSCSLLYSRLAQFHLSWVTYKVLKLVKIRSQNVSTSSVLLLPQHCNSVLLPPGIKGLNILNKFQAVNKLLINTRKNYETATNYFVYRKKKLSKKLSNYKKNLSHYKLFISL